MKKSKFLIVLVSLLLSSCGNQEEVITRKLYEKDFENDSSFITFADLPPSPLSTEDLSLYKALGMNTCILTEDKVSFTKDGEITDSYKQAIHNIGNAGMDVWIRNMYNDPDYFQSEETKYGSNYGSPYNFEARNITDEFDEFPEVTGFYMSDEPYENTSDPYIRGEIEPGDLPYAAMDQYEKLVNWKNEYYPDLAWHMNHVPSSSYNHWPEGETYESFIKYYINNIVAKLKGCSSKTVSLDNYPFPANSNGTMKQSYLTDLLCAAIATKEYNDSVSDVSEWANFGFCIQNFEDTTSTVHLDAPTTVEELTYQLYSGMSMGAKTIEYFCYRSLTGLAGLIDNDGNPRAYYYLLQQANEKALPMAKIVNSFNFKNYIVSKATESDDRENNTSFDNISIICDQNNKGTLKSFTSRLDCSCGYFKNTNNQDAYMFVSQTYPKNGQVNTVKLEFEGCNQALIYHEGKAEYVELLNGKTRLIVKPGDAYFVIPA